MSRNECFNFSQETQNFKFNQICWSYRFRPRHQARPISNRYNQAIPETYQPHRATVPYGPGKSRISFLPDLAQNTAQMRKLLSPKNTFLWLPEHEQQFFKTKEILTSKFIVKPFDINLPTILFTDAS